jgi:hypothetical protein
LIEATPGIIDNETKGRVRSESKDFRRLSREGEKDLGGIEDEKELLVPFKIGKNCFKFRKLFWSNAGESDPKAIATDPTHSGFVNSQRPIQAGNVEPAFKL